MTNHLASSSSVPITPAETAAMLERIERKLDLVLERLEWSPRSEVDWYGELHPKHHLSNLDPTDKKKSST